MTRLFSLDQKVVREFVEIVPNFRFVINVPSSVSLTHHYKKKKIVPLVQNPHFISAELWRGLESLEPLHANLGLMFRFE